MNTGNTDNIAWEARGQITVDIKGAGSFTFVLDLYESSNFTMKRDSSQYPVRLSVQDDIYLEVQFESVIFKLDSLKFSCLVVEYVKRSADSKFIHRLSMSCNK